jgi:hypothetical protein
MNDKGGETPADHTGGGVGGNHPSVEQFKIVVGPSTGGEFNTARLRLVPLACWRVEDVRFDFDSSFVLPDVKQEIQLLARLIAAHTKPDRRPPPLSIFGHADPVGNDDYNKGLSGRRAAAIYGMLTRRDEVWEDLFSDGGNFARPAAGDKWGLRSIQIMLNELKPPVPMNGNQSPETTAAIRQFQTSHGLSPDGNAGPATRKKLFLAYMDQVCVDDEDRPLKVDKTEGVLGHNQDAHGKADFQGCGELNPVLVFSKNRNSDFENDADKTARNAANAPNRRVMALLFRPGTRVTPARWPCPRAKEGLSDCRKRLWSDGEKRRTTRLPDKDRKFKDRQDTFSCRFYQRQVALSPCERVAEFWVIRVLEDGPEPISKRRPIANQPFSVTGAGGVPAEIRGVTDRNGVLRIPVRDDPALMTLRIAGIELKLAGGSLQKLNDGPVAIVQRLSNLGFLDAGRSDLEEVFSDALSVFQKLHSLAETGEADRNTQKKLRELHGS